VLNFRWHVISPRQHKFDFFDDLNLAPYFFARSGVVPLRRMMSLISILIEMFRLGRNKNKKECSCC
jgi:hypothetical protein